MWAAHVILKRIRDHVGPYTWQVCPHVLSSFLHEANTLPFFLKKQRHVSVDCHLLSSLNLQTHQAHLVLFEPSHLPLSPSSSAHLYSLTCQLLHCSPSLTLILHLPSQPILSISSSPSKHCLLVIICQAQPSPPSIVSFPPFPSFLPIKMIKEIRKGRKKKTKRILPFETMRPVCAN